MASVYSSRIPLSKNGSECSPGGSFRSARRMAAIDRESIFIATDNLIKTIKIKYKSNDIAFVAADAKSPFSITHPMEDLTLSPFPVLHRSEIMSIRYRSNDDVLFSVDSVGNVGLTNVKSGRSVMFESFTEPCLPFSSVADIDFAKVDLKIVASVHAESNRLLIHDVESRKVISSHWTRHSPNAVSFVDDSATIICVLEQSQFSMWDTRISEGNCLTKQFQPSYERLNCLDILGNSLCCAGESGILYIYDLRKSSLVARTAAPSKREVIGMKRSNINNSLMYGLGNDNELMGCHMVEKEKGKSSLGKLHLNQHKSFRGASNWIGFDVLKNYGDSKSDTILAVCSEGQVYTIDNAHHLSPESSE